MGGIGIGVSPAFGGFVPVPYIEKVLALDDSLIAYWIVNETSGSTADNAEGTAARDGTITGVTLNNSTGPDSEPVGLWDGANDYIETFTASLDAAFDGDEGTIHIWAKVSAVGVWTDAAGSRFALRFRVDGNNSVGISIGSNDNEIVYRYEAGGTLEEVLKTSVTETGWMSLAITWSASGDAVKMYYNGVQEGATQTGLGTWAGGLNGERTLIGAGVNTPTSVWDGWLAHASVWSSALTGAKILELATT